MNLRVISRNVGYALLVSALFMFLSAFVSIVDGHDSAFAPLLVSALITFMVGAFPLIFVRRTSVLTLKDGYLTIVLSWLLSFIFGMLPYALWGGPFTLENAWFESVSGFTTTGATILDNIEALPRSLLFWRSATHFIGGLGVVVFLLLIIPNSSPVKLRLTSMELSSLSKDSYSARANKTVYIFAYVYLGLAILAFISYLLAGMSPFDAVCHAFSVSATGGFSTKNLSIAAFDSRVIELLTMIFMLLSSLHFGLVFLTFATKSLKPLKNPVLKFYLSSLAILIVLVGLSLKFQGAQPSFGKALWEGAFQTISVATTTGFAIADNASWPMLPSILLMFAAFMCGCAGSTTGGVKADRVLVLIKSVGRQISKILHPSSVNEIKMGSRIIREEEASPHLLYIAMYCGILAVSTMLAILFGANTHAAFSGSLSSLGNVGPAIKELGFMGSFNSVTPLAKFIFTMDMFLGRVEIYPVLAVVAMIFDRRRNQL